MNTETPEGGCGKGTCNGQCEFTNACPNDSPLIAACHVLATEDIPLAKHQQDALDIVLDAVTATRQPPQVDGRVLEACKPFIKFVEYITGCWHKDKGYKRHMKRLGVTMPVTAGELYAAYEALSAAGVIPVNEEVTASAILTGKEKQS